MRTNKKTEDEKSSVFFSLMGVQTLNFFHIGEGTYNFLKYGLEKSYFLGYISRVS